MQCHAIVLNTTGMNMRTPASPDTLKERKNERHQQLLVAVYPSMLRHIRMGKLAGWRPRSHHERVRESYMMNFV